MITDAEIRAELQTKSQRAVAREYGLTRWRVAQAALGREEASQGAPADSAAPAPADDAERPPYEVREDGKIFINWLARTIVTDLGEFGTVVFGFDKHAAMRRRYSDVWESSRETIPEIGRDFDLSPAAFDRYKTVHRWTHGSDPFTDEEWREGLTVEQAVAQTLESHRRVFHKELQKETWKGIIADAQKWRRFEETAVRPIVEAISAHAPAYTPPRLALAQPRSRFSVVLSVPDAHLGKRSSALEVDAPYDFATARRLVLEKTGEILGEVARYGEPNQILTTVGSDWFHVDTYGGTTTAGTPQDLDGSAYEMLWNASEVAIQQIDLLRQVAPVRVIYVPGNHDRLTSWGLLYAVHAWFRQCADVTVHQSAKPRQYVAIGQTLLGFAHGDEVKKRDLPLLMATEAPDLWGQTRHRAVFTGHVHHEAMVDHQGVAVYTLPSLSGSDRWHQLKGYVGSRRAVTAYLIDHQAGVVGSIIAPV